MTGCANFINFPLDGATPESTGLARINRLGLDSDDPQNRK
jgi:hypothetical protein